MKPAIFSFLVVVMIVALLPGCNALVPEREFGDLDEPCWDNHTCNQPFLECQHAENPYCPAEGDDPLCYYGRCVCPDNMTGHTCQDCRGLPCGETCCPLNTVCYQGACKPLQEIPAPEWLGQNDGLSGAGQGLALDGDAAAVAFSQGSSGPRIQLYYKGVDGTFQKGDLVSASNYSFNPKAIALRGDSLLVTAEVNSTRGGTVLKRATSTSWNSSGPFLGQTPSGSLMTPQSVGLSGDYAIIGSAYNSGDNEDGNLPSAHVFQRTAGNTWSAPAELSIPALTLYTSDQRFNNALIDGDYAIVAQEGTDKTEVMSFQRTSGNTWSGPVTVFDSSIGGVHLTTTISTSADDGGGGLRRLPIALGSDSLIVAGWKETSGRTDPSGQAKPFLPAPCVLVFRRTGANTWDSGTEMVLPDTPTPSLPASVATREGYVLLTLWEVSGYQEDKSSNPGQYRKAHVYLLRATQDPNTWKLHAAISLPGGNLRQSSEIRDDPNNYFGFDVDLDGDDGIIRGAGNKAYLFSYKF